MTDKMDHKREEASGTCSGDCIEIPGIGLVKEKSDSSSKHGHDVMENGGSVPCNVGKSAETDLVMEDDPSLAPQFSYTETFQRRLRQGHVSTSVTDYENSPKSLFRLCILKLRNDTSLLTKEFQRRSEPLPAKIMEPFFDDREGWDAEKYGNALTLASKLKEKQLEDGKSVKLVPAGIIHRLAVPFSGVPQQAILETIRNQKLVDLDIGCCKGLDAKVLEAINKNGQDMISLNLGWAARSILHPYGTQSPVLKTPKLQKICIHAAYPPDYDPESLPDFDTIFSELTELIHVDVSRCTCLKSLSFLRHPEKLCTLILRGTAGHSIPPEISEMGNLRFLDISGRWLFDPENFSDPDQTLEGLVTTLPNLEGLDISFTNLAGSGTRNPSNRNSECTADIVGLRSRTGRPLQFLGLYGTPNGACRRANIPALTITGDSCPEQLLNAAEAYFDRPDIVEDVVLKLRRRPDMLAPTLIKKATEIMQWFLRTHVEEHPTNLYVNTWLRRIECLPVSVAHSIMKTTLFVLSQTPEEEIPALASYIFSDSSTYMNEMLAGYFQRFVREGETINEIRHSSVHRRSISLLYRVSEVLNEQNEQNDQNLVLSSSIEVAMEVVHSRLDSIAKADSNEYRSDGTIWCTWNFLYHLTAEAQENACWKLYGCGGLKAFLGCFLYLGVDFDDADDPPRGVPMMKCMEAMVRPHALRRKLMKSPYCPELIASLNRLLESPAQERQRLHQVLACLILTPILADGPDAWTSEYPKRSVVVETLSRAIRKFRVRDCYRPFHIFDRMPDCVVEWLGVMHTEVVCYAAVFILASFTSNSKSGCGIYRRIVREEGGLDALRELSLRSTHFPKMFGWMAMIEKNCRN